MGIRIVWGMGNNYSQEMRDVDNSSFFSKLSEQGERRIHIDAECKWMFSRKPQNVWNPHTRPNQIERCAGRSAERRQNTNNGHILYDNFINCP